MTLFLQSCILSITAAAGTELAEAYPSNAAIDSSPGKEVHDTFCSTFLPFLFTKKERGEFLKFEAFRE